MKAKLHKKIKAFELKTGQLAPNKYTSYNALVFIVIGAIAYCVIIFPYWSAVASVSSYASGF